MSCAQELNRMELRFKKKKKQQRTRTHSISKQSPNLKRAARRLGDDGELEKD
jgi:hypothetical protein